MNPLSETFDEFVDDLLSSDVDLLKGELDFLLIQHLFSAQALGSKYGVYIVLLHIVCSHNYGRYAGLLHEFS